MTSTASRLSVVQREIEGLESSLNPDPRSRTAHLRRKIVELERELAAAERGRHVPSSAWVCRNCAVVGRGTGLASAASG